MAFGNAEQQQRFLPGIASGEVWWSQGYSEPGSGSDLASVKTRAERVGDKYIVNGQKTWTTLGQHGDWIFCLVRTEPDAPKHEGISYILFNLVILTQGADSKNFPNPLPSVEWHIGHAVLRLREKGGRVPAGVPKSKKRRQSMTQLLGSTGCGSGLGGWLRMASPPRRRRRLRCAMATGWRSLAIR